MFLIEEFRAGGEPPERPKSIPHSKGWPARRDPAAEPKLRSSFDNLGEGAAHKLRQRTAPPVPR